MKRDATVDNFLSSGKAIIGRIDKLSWNDLKWEFVDDDGQRIMEEKTWTIVKFVDEDMVVEAVPTKWLLGNRCYWPPYTREKLINSIKKLEPPNTCWPQHIVEIFRNGTYDDYARARNKCKIAENYSDLNSEFEELANGKTKKIRRKKQVLSSSDDELEEEHITGGLPLPPKLMTPKTNEHDNSHKQNNNHLICRPVSPTAQSFSSIGSGKSSGIGSNKENDSCLCCEKNGDILKNIYRQQIFLKNLCGDILEKVNKINIGAPSHCEIVSSIFVTFPHFPINCDDDMENLNQFLSNIGNFDVAVKELSKIGGNNLYDLIKRCMSMLITNSYGDEYSWLGAKKKKKFFQQKMAELLLDRSGLSGDRKATEIAIKNWLRRAKERSGKTMGHTD